MKNKGKWLMKVKLGDGGEWGGGDGDEQLRWQWQLRAIAAMLVANNCVSVGNDGSSSDNDSNGGDDRDNDGGNGNVDSGSSDNEKFEIRVLMERVRVDNTTICD